MATTPESIFPALPAQEAARRFTRLAEEAAWIYSRLAEAETAAAVQADAAGSEALRRRTTHLWQDLWEVLEPLRRRVVGRFAQRYSRCWCAPGLTRATSKARFIWPCGARPANSTQPEGPSPPSWTRFSLTPC
jgi:hypothetical protein